MQRYLFSAYMISFSAYDFPVVFQKNIIFVTESIFYKHYFFHKFSFSSQNLFLLSIIQHVIASKSNHINIMLPNEMVLAPLQKLKIKYELSYQSTTRLKYIDKFDQLLIIHQKKIVKWYGKYGRNVRWYGKYGGKVSWIVKRFGKYRRGAKTISLGNIVLMWLLLEAITCCSIDSKNRFWDENENLDNK